MSYYDYDEDFDFYDDYDFDDVERKKKGKGKLIAIILGVVLAIAAVVGVLAVVFKNKTEQVAQESCIQAGLVMYETPELRLGSPQGIRFKAIVSPELKKEVEADKNKSFGFIVAPLSYFLKVDVNDGLENTDWLAAFEEEDLNVLHVEDCAVVTKSNADGAVMEHFIQGSLTDILYHNTNLEFMSFAYVKTTDGENASYKYASYPSGVNYKTQARSLAYLSAEALNEKIINYTYYSDADVAVMRGFINNSVDLANGLTEATNDNSVYAVTLSATEKTLQLGEEFTLKADIEENVKTPVWWTTDNAGIVTVKNGVITATGIGTTMVSAYVAGEKYSCTVTVKKVVETDTENEEEQTEVA